MSNSPESMMIQVPTGICCHCGQDGYVEMPYKQFCEGRALYDKGALMQDAYKELDVDLREQMISGTHPKCWIEMFSPTCSQHDLP